VNGPPVSVTLRDHFTLQGEYLTLLERGKKHTTIRWRPGALDFPAAAVLPLYVAGEPAGRVRVRRFTHLRWEDVGHPEAWRDGFPDARSMRAALEGFYPGLKPDCWVTIYGIRLLDGEGS
jgi:hypothetical protein